MGPQEPAGNLDHVPLTPLSLRQAGAISSIDAPAWDALFPSDFPFTRHAFLAALEAHGCVGPGTGWTPCHLVAHDAQGALCGAMPLYLKTHSYGEFVFDFSWAGAAERLGLDYYPKLLGAIPFSPVTGARLGGAPAVQAVLRDAVAGLVESPGAGISSAHVLFLDAPGAALFGSAQSPAPRTGPATGAAGGWLERHDIQFHWGNRGYASFDDFLSQLSHDKRKKIRQERKRVAQLGLAFEMRGGDTLTVEEWRAIYPLYANTYEERGQPPYLTPGFLLDYGRAPGTPVQVILGRERDGSIACCALCLRGGDTLYGRHWGTRIASPGLHFETCYYQGIEWCISAGLSRYDAGAQGMHKLARGFDPVLTRSAHRIGDARLHRAVASYLQGERRAVENRRQELTGHRAYRRDDDGKPDPAALAGSA